MKLKLFLAIIPAIIAATTLSAQIKVLAPTGKVKIGIEPPPSVGSDDPNSLARLHVYGSNGDARAAGKIAVGDFGSFAWNVFVGEYGTNDVDQLWLNGRLGMYLTYGQYGQNVIGYYDPAQGNAFRYNCDVYANGIMLSSDARFKTNVQKLGGALEQLTKLQGVSYNLLPHELNKAAKSGILPDAAKSVSGTMSEKERKAKEFDDKIAKEQSQPGPKRLGLIAQEVQQVFPELVKQDSSNYLYVDYIGLIPVLIEGMKEQESIIDAQNEKIRELESRLSSLENKISGLTNAGTGIDIASGVSAGSYLFQNTPNPFRSTTVINYFIAANVKEATINVFDMQGALKKTIPLSHVTGKSQVTINGSELKAGMYIYNLVTDGNEVDVKRMTLME